MVIKQRHTLKIRHVLCLIWSLKVENMYDSFSINHFSNHIKNIPKITKIAKPALAKNAKIHLSSDV